MEADMPFEIRCPKCRTPLQSDESCPTCMQAEALDDEQQRRLIAQAEKTEPAGVITPDLVTEFLNKDWADGIA